jgi:hypothetical protein
MAAERSVTSSCSRAPALAFTHVTSTTPDVAGELGYGDMRDPSFDRVDVETPDGRGALPTLEAYPAEK